MKKTWPFALVLAFLALSPALALAETDFTAFIALSAELAKVAQDEQGDCEAQASAFGSCADNAEVKAARELVGEL